VPPLPRVRKMPSWARSRANFSLLQLWSHRNARANRNAWTTRNILGQPNTLLQGSGRWSSAPDPSLALADAGDGVGLGFGRIVASETEAPNMFVNLV
jgi:hypothetical protein